MKFRTACQDPQAGETAVKMYFPRTQQSASSWFKPITCRLQSLHFNKP